MYHTEEGDRVLYVSRRNAEPVKLDEPTLPIDQAHFVVTAPAGDFTGFKTLHSCLETIRSYDRLDNYFAIVQR